MEGIPEEKTDLETENPCTNSPLKIHTHSDNGNEPGSTEATPTSIEPYQHKPEPGSGTKGHNKDVVNWTARRNSFSPWAVVSPPCSRNGKRARTHHHSIIPLHRGMK